MARALFAIVALTFLSLSHSCTQDTGPSSLVRTPVAADTLQRTFISRETFTTDPICDEPADIIENAEYCCRDHGLGCDNILETEEDCRQPDLTHGQMFYCCSEYNLHCSKIGDSCSHVKPCTEGQCVFTHLFLHRGGKCKPEMPDAPECSVDYCTLKGEGATCTVGHLMTEYATCGAWHEFVHGSGGHLCNFVCPKICWNESRRPMGSDGQLYCTDCILKLESCMSGFEVFGPVENIEPEATPEGRSGELEEEELEATPDAMMTIPEDSDCVPAAVLPSDAYRCCAEFGVGCLQNGEECTTLGSMIPPVPCGDSLTCVVEDFGFPATDVPNRGTCMKLESVVEECSLDLCTKNGASELCRLAEDSSVTSCGGWAKRSDGGDKPDCEFSCALFCEVGENAPVGSDGRPYCSVCQLQSVSCASDFDIYGPINA